MRNKWRAALAALVVLQAVAVAPRPAFVPSALSVSDALATGLSNTEEQGHLERLFKQTAESSVTVLYVSLHGTDPGDTCANEISGGNYSRAQLNPDTNNSTNTNWNAIGAGTGGAQRISNKLPITFPQANASWFSGAQIPYFCLMGHASNATPCYGCGSFTGGGPVVTNTVTLVLPGGTPGSVYLDLN